MFNIASWIYRLCGGKVTESNMGEIEKMETINVAISAVRDVGGLRIVVEVPWPEGWSTEPEKLNKDQKTLLSMAKFASNKLCEEIKHQNDMGD